MQINAIRILGVHKLTFLFFLFLTVKRRCDVSNLFYYILDHITKCQSCSGPLLIVVNEPHAVLLSTNPYVHDNSCIFICDCNIRT